MVIAQFTGVACRTTTTAGSGTTAAAWGGVSNFSEYRNADPDDIGMKLAVAASTSAPSTGNHSRSQRLRHRPGRAPLDRVRRRADLTNSNSNFGGCSALSEGYQDEAPPQDTGFSATHQRVPTDLSEKTNNIRRTYIGTINAGVANNATAITLRRRPDWRHRQRARHPQRLHLGAWFVRLGRVTHQPGLPRTAVRYRLGRKHQPGHDQHHVGVPDRRQRRDQPQSRRRHPEWQRLTPARTIPTSQAAACTSAASLTPAPKTSAAMAC